MSYVPKKNRSVIVLSTMHHDNFFDQNTKKPEIIIFYNDATKGGVDALDQKCAIYRSGRRCRRWPLVIWYAIMYIATVNNIIFLAAYPGVKKNRLYFMEALGLSLIKNHLQNRLEIQNFLKELRSITSRALGTEMAHEEQPRRKA